MNNDRPRLKRVVLKLSGEALMGELTFGLSPSVLAHVAASLKAFKDKGVQVIVVVGGGNIFRGLRCDEYGVGRVAGDHMGMLATIINSIALGQAVRHAGTAAAVMSAFKINEVALPYTVESAEKRLARDEIVIVGAGTGNPFFTTDTAAVLRAAELGADAVLKATKVDGVYDADPELNPGALRFDSITYREVIDRGLKVMDLTAVSLAMDRRIPIIVFNLDAKGNMQRILAGEPVGSLISGEQR
jgi:uridylate kinase